jgi:ferrochelatase
LIATSRSVQQKLAAQLGEEMPVYLAMRYGEPSVASVIAKIIGDGVEELLLIPQYPHYAMSSLETVTVKVYAEAARQSPNLRVTTVQPFYEDTDYIEALYTSAKPYLEQPHDYVLFSFHGLPERHLRKADSSKAHCTIVANCCETCSPSQNTCYRAQCYKTTKAFVQRANLAPERHSISFQSRLAGEPWLTPYTDHELIRLPSTGAKRLLVMTPAFVTDCLETLEEISITGKESFIAAGGASFKQIPCLNDHPAYIDFLLGRVRRWAKNA